MSLVIQDKEKNKIIDYLKKNKKTDLIGAYLFFVEERFKIKPVLFPKQKKIYQSINDLINKLETEGALWRETQITVQYGQQSVNDQTTKIYICPYTGKVFGDNTHPNPQDAIYDWVSTCPENTERIGGLKAKRFFVSEDPQVIKNYISERKASVKKNVFSSAVSGKLFNSKEAVIDDFKKNHIKRLSLFEVQNQNRFEIEEDFLNFLQKQLTEKNISDFVEALAKHDDFSSYLNKWLEK